MHQIAIKNLRPYGHNEKTKDRKEKRETKEDERTKSDLP